MATQASGAAADETVGLANMTSLVWQIVGIVLVIGTIWIGFRSWRQRIDHKPSRSETLAAIVLSATLAGGFWGAFAWWQNLSYAFPWPLPGLAAHMLAVAGWSFALASALALRCSYPTHLRLVHLMLWVYLAPLTLAILILHLDRFDFAREVTVTFFIIVVLLLVASTIALVTLPRSDPVAGAPPGTIASWALRLIGGVAGLWAVVLFVKPDGPWPLIWPWPGDALTTRLIASMFLAISVGALAALPSQWLARTVFWTTVTYGAGVVIAGFAHVMTAKPSPMGYAVVTPPVSYMVVWGALGIVAALALVASQHAGVEGLGRRAKEG